MRELDVTTFYPLLMLLYGLPESDLSVEQRSETLDAIESWLARRAFCGWPTKQYNKVVPALVSQLLQNPGNAHDTIIGSLRAFDGSTAAWPTDEEFVATLVQEPTYGRLRQSRVRMLLAGIEGYLRHGLSEQLSNVGKLHIEHVLPQQWQSHWPLEQTVDAHLASARRDEAKHMLGNLTLLTDKLNLKQSNQAWEDKRERLQRTLCCCSTSACSRLSPTRGMRRRSTQGRESWQPRQQRSGRAPTTVGGRVSAR